MTTYVDDGVEFSQDGREFVGVVDRESHYQGFECRTCGEDFTRDPSDHVCRPTCTECGVTLTRDTGAYGPPGWYDDAVTDMDNNGRSCPETGDEHNVEVGR